MAGSGEGLSYRADEAHAPFSAFNVIGLAAKSLSQNASCVISNDCSGAGLAAVDSEIEPGFDTQGIALQ